jgi:hypothetical protein
MKVHAAGAARTRPVSTGTARAASENEAMAKVSAPP